MKYHLCNINFSFLSYLSLFRSWCILQKLSARQCFVLFTVYFIYPVIHNSNIAIADVCSIVDNSKTTSPMAVMAEAFNKVKSFGGNQLYICNGENIESESKKAVCKLSLEKSDNKIDFKFIVKPNGTDKVTMLCNKTMTAEEYYNSIKKNNFFIYPFSYNNLYFEVKGNRGNPIINEANLKHYAPGSTYVKNCEVEEKGYLKPAMAIKSLKLDTTTNGRVVWSCGPNTYFTRSRELGSSNFLIYNQSLEKLGLKPLVPSACLDKIKNDREITGFLFSSSNVLTFNTNMKKLRSYIGSKYEGCTNAINEAEKKNKSIIYMHMNGFSKKGDLKKGKENKPEGQDEALTEERFALYEMMMGQIFGINVHTPYSGSGPSGLTGIDIFRPTAYMEKKNGKRVFASTVAGEEEKRLLAGATAKKEDMPELHFYTEKTLKEEVMPRTESQNAVMMDMVLGSVLNKDKYEGYQEGKTTDPEVKSMLADKNCLKLKEMYDEYNPSSSTSERKSAELASQISTSAAISTSVAISSSLSPSSSSTTTTTTTTTSTTSSSSERGSIDEQLVMKLTQECAQSLINYRKKDIRHLGGISQLLSNIAIAVDPQQEMVGGHCAGGRHKTGILSMGMQYLLDPWYLYGEKNSQYAYKNKGDTFEDERRPTSKLERGRNNSVELPDMENEYDPAQTEYFDHNAVMVRKSNLKSTRLFFRLLYEPRNQSLREEIRTMYGNKFSDEVLDSYVTELQNLRAKLLKKLEKCK